MLMHRRDFLALAGRSSQYLIAGAFLGACSKAHPPTETFDTSSPSARRAGRSMLAGLGELRAPDGNGIRLPAGFSSRVVAVSGQPPVENAPYNWHPAPDGGAVFGTNDGGWIYVSNSELRHRQGGVGALRFEASGRLADAYPILGDTNRNCAGGATPWQTWLSCEEVFRGRVWECDPAGRNPAVVRPALGRFWHEAVAVDPHSHQLYMTEDRPDGCWYRFTPARVDAHGRADLSTGLLEVAASDGGVVAWRAVPDPSARSTPTRYQVSGSTPFNGGEGIGYCDGIVYFTTKGDGLVWGYEIATARLYRVYDASLAETPWLRGADNLAVGQAGDVLIAEDGDDMQIVVLSPGGAVQPLLQVVGHGRSEVTGPAFTPDYQRLYFSSQRGATGRSDSGVTYEITGPFAGDV
jgi:uncharacterized protein